MSYSFLLPALGPASYHPHQQHLLINFQLKDVTFLEIRNFCWCLLSTSSLITSLPYIIWCRAYTCSMYFFYVSYLCARCET
jgi:hypothetical protein